MGSEKTLRPHRSRSLKMAGPQRHPVTGIYSFRKVIPERLRPIAGKREFKVSLNTKDAAEAKAAYRVQETAYRRYIEGLEVRLAPPSTPQPIALTPRHLAALAGDLRRHILDQHRDDPAPGEAFGSREMREAWFAPLTEETEEARQREAEAKQHGPWDLHLDQLMADHENGQPINRSGALRHFTEPFLRGRGIGLTSADDLAFHEGAFWSLLGALQDLRRRAHGDWSDAPDLVKYPKWEPPVATEPKVRITKLIETWEKRQSKVNEKTRKTFANRARALSVFLEHDDATRVEPTDMRRWRDHLKESGLSASTINDGYIAAAKTLFEASVAEELLATNPAAGKSILLKATTSTAKKRRGYSDDEAAVLLKYARKEELPSRRWLPWLMAYTGTRIGEPAQLHAKDVGVLRGVPFVSFNTDEEGKSLKNLSSVRTVPIHPALVEEGFLAFAAKAKGPLFPELYESKAGKKPRPADRASKNYNRWARRIGVKDKAAVGHSWRHRMSDLFTDLEVPLQVSDAILGHATPGQGRGYGRGVTLKTKHEWLSKVPTIRV